MPCSRSPPPARARHHVRETGEDPYGERERERRNSMEIPRRRPIKQLQLERERERWDLQTKGWKGRRGGEEREGVGGLDVVVDVGDVGGGGGADEVAALVVEVEVGAGGGEDGAEDAALDEGALEDVLLLVGKAHGEVAEGEPPHGDLGAALQAHGDAHAAAVHAAEGDALHGRHGARVERAVGGVLVVVRLHDDPHAQVVEDDAAVGDVAHVPAAPRGRLDPHPAPRVPHQHLLHRHVRHPPGHLAPDRYPRAATHHAGQTPPNPSYNSE